MSSGDMYHKKIKGLGKKKIQNKQELQKEIRKIFLSNISTIPKNMVFDIFAYFLGEVENSERFKDEYDLAYYLSSVVDLFNTELDEVNDNLIDNDWVAIREICSEFSNEIDENILMYIMQKILAHGMIS